MPNDERTAAASLALSIGVAAVAACLVAWLWYERRHRDPDLPEVDADHFARQDLRRGAVALILIFLSVGISVGSRVEPKVAGKTNRLFLLIWLGVFVLILVLLALALVDWVSTRLYARRHLRALARERIDLLRDELRRRSAPRHGLNGSADPIGDPPP